MTDRTLSEKDFSQLKAFLGYFSKRFLGADSLPGASQPLAVLEALERVSRSKARRGLVMAVRDCVEMSSDWLPDRISAVDAELADKNIVSLSELRRRYSRRFLSILKKGKINSEEDYYLVKGVLGSESVELGHGEATALQHMIDAYETNRATGKHRTSTGNT